MQPPHRQAANFYRKIRVEKDGEFIVTMEHPKPSDPKPLVIEIDRFHATVKKALVVGTPALTSVNAPRAGSPMTAPFLSLSGVVVTPATLALPRARALAELVGRGNLPFVNLVECRCVIGDISSEIVVIDIIVERPQAPVRDIRHGERVAVTFFATDSTYPSVLSLRPDFPSVPHLNFTSTEYPKSLCLYDRPWSEVALRWTPVSLVRRIRYWMAQTARGTLHQEDQPLEPLLFDNGMRIVLSVDILSKSGVRQRGLD